MAAVTSCANALWRKTWLTFDHIMRMEIRVIEISMLRFLFVFSEKISMYLMQII
jgi:hypothetical protein